MRNTTMQVTTSINNIIVGKLNIDHGGIMAVRNPTHGLAAKMKFKQPGLLQFRGEAHVVNPPPPPTHTHPPFLWASFSRSFLHPQTLRKGFAYVAGNQ